jgi:hypothetical protein
MGHHIFTRQELYDLVWSEPMVKIAERYGISGRGLAKACARASIPVPERGYWAKAQAGQKVKQPPLPPLKTGMSDRISIDPPGPKAEKPAPPPVPASVQAKIDEEHRSGKEVKVPATLANPHRIVAAWVEADRKEQAEARRDRFMGSFYKPPTEATKRGWRVSSALYNAIEARGYRLIVDRQYYGHSVQIELKNEKVDIEVSERIRQYRRYLTEEEMRKRGDLSTGRKWTQEKEPTGELVCKLKVFEGYGWSAEWRDRPDRPLENQLNDILAGLAGGFEAIRLDREEKAEIERQRWKAEEERRVRENERKRELIRYRRLLRKVDNWETAARIRRFVAAIDASIPAEGASEDRQSFDKWSQWALAHADRVDPVDDDDLFDMEVTDSELWSLRD